MARRCSPNRPMASDRSRRKAKTFDQRRLKVAVNRSRYFEPDLQTELNATDDAFPQLRAECLEAIRPCPHLRCKNHLAVDVNPRTGSMKDNFPGTEVSDLQHTCALDLAEAGGMTLKDVGESMNISSHAVSLIEQKAFEKIDAAFPEIAESGGFLDWLDEKGSHLRRRKAFIRLIKRVCGESSAESIGKEIRAFCASASS